MVEAPGHVMCGDAGGSNKVLNFRDSLGERLLWGQDRLQWKQLGQGWVPSPLTGLSGVEVSEQKEISTRTEDWPVGKAGQWEQPQGLSIRMCPRPSYVWTKRHQEKGGSKVRGWRSQWMTSFGGGWGKPRGSCWLRDKQAEGRRVTGRGQAQWKPWQEPCGLSSRRES